MLRRVGPALRLGLFTFGIALLLWLPVSYWVVVYTRVPLPTGREEGLTLGWGRLRLVSIEPGGAIRSLPKQASVGRITSSDARPFIAYGRLAPVGGGSYLWMHVPIWALSALCLAWPLTAFVIARLKKRRGFPVGFAEEQAEA